MPPDLPFRSATELGAMIRASELSAVELVAATLDAASASQASINAFVTICADEALAQAKQAEDALRRDRSLGPLHGLPFVVKDLTLTAGVRTTFGSRTHEHHVPAEDAVAVARLKAAGAILVGKTTTPEFGHKPFTDSPLFGTTVNPWDHDRTCGGSSGGTAAAVAAGIAALGLGTDGGGSIRIPASCCGVVGLKPTIGSVPHVQAPDTFNNLSHVGPMTRSVADARLMYDVMAAPHRDDLLSGANWAARRQRESVRGLRVGWLPKVGGHGVDPDVMAAATALVDVLAGDGADVVPIDIDLVALEPVFLTIMRSGLYARQRRLLQERRDEISDTFARTIELGADIDALSVHAALDARTAIFRKIQALFERVDVLVSPTLTRTALPLSQDPFGSVVVAGVEYPSLRSAWNPYTYVFNLTGHPALSVPCGWSSDGLPIGAQFVGPLGSDRFLLDLAERWEALRPWRHRRPGAPAGPAV